MSGGYIVLPAMTMTGGKRGGRTYIDLDNLVAFLYKAAADPEQHPVAAQAFRMLAEETAKVGSEV